MINKKTSNCSYKWINLTYLNNYRITMFEIPFMTFKLTSNKREERRLVFETLYKDFFALSIRGTS